MAFRNGPLIFFLLPFAASAQPTDVPRADLTVDSGDAPSSRQWAASFDDFRHGDLSAEQLAEQLVLHGEFTKEELTQLKEAKLDNPEFKTIFADKAYSQVHSILLNRTSADAAGLRKAARIVLGAEEPSYERIARLIDLAEKADHFSATEDVNRLIVIRDDLQDKREREVVDVRLVKLLLRYSESSLSKDEPEVALRQLAEIAPAFRGKESREQTARAIVLSETMLNSGGAKLEKDWPFDDPKVADLTADVEGVDPGVKISLANIYAKRVLFALRHNNSKTANEYFSAVLKRREDPNVANDKLRLESALNARGPDARYFAVGRIDELRSSGKLGIMGRIKLVMSGFYNKLYPILISIIIGTTVATFLAYQLGSHPIKLKLPKREIHAPHLGGISGIKMPPMPQLGGPKRPARGYERSVTSDDEYARLLAVFGLDDSASEDQIKKAFRQIMKGYHPDAAQETGENVDTFIELRKAYERILEIRGSWFGKR